MKKSVGYIPKKAEITLLEKIVEAEAGAEPYNCKVAVVNVIFNRIKSKKFPDNITSVIYQPYQFETATDSVLNNIKVSADSKRAVKEAIAGKQIIKDNVLYFWANYLGKDNPLWREMSIVTSIGTTDFGVERK